MAAIALEGVRKQFADSVAIDDATLSIEDGEFVAIVGPSGCGKSTLLRIVAGLERATAGRVLIGGRDVTSLAPKARDVAMVFQDYALFPQMTVEQNLSFGLRVRRVPGAQARARVHEVATTLHLEELLHRRPDELSGGQKQRVAIGRAIIREPQAFLMDEPLSNLDAALRTHMRGELGRLRESLRVTTLYVTHDQVEAMTLGDRVVVMDHGSIQQIDTPLGLYEHPANAFVAATIGAPAMNLLELPVRGGTVSIGGAAVPLPAPVMAGDRVIVGLRPTALHTEPAPHELTFRCVPDVVELLGAEKRVLFRLSGTPVSVGRVSAGRVDDTLTPLVGDGTARDRVDVTAVVDGKAVVSPGDPLTLALDPEDLYFFDATSRRATGRGSATRAA